jgi:hypothetical protein
MEITNYEEMSAVATSLGLELEIDEASFVGCLYKTARTGNRKLKYGYRYRSAERMFQDLKTYLENTISNKELDAKRKVETKAKNEEIDSKIQVGDVFVCSWGWEQTNINFYQVVARKGKKTVTVREIAKVQTESDGEGYYYDYVKPAKDHFVGEEEDHRLNGGYFRINSFMSASLVEDLNKSHYRSWGY